MIIARWSHAKPGQRLDGGLARPMVINDQIDRFKSMADGKEYESKSEYRASLKAQGLVETAGCNLPTRAPGPPPITKQDLSDAWDRFDQQTEAGVPREEAAGGFGKLPEQWEGTIE